MNFKLPEMPPKPQMENVTIAVFNHPVFRPFVPEEAAISYPVPKIIGGEPIVFYFHYWHRTFPEKQLSRPLTHITALVKPEPEWVEIIEYKIGKPESLLFPELPDPIPLARISMQRSERKNLELALYMSCEHLLFLRESDIIAEAKRTFVSALSRLIPPGLMPFYQRMNPEFFLSDEQS